MTSNLIFRSLVIAVVLGVSIFAIVVGSIDLGIDLRGGSILTYEVEKLAEGGQVTQGDITTEELSDTVQVISDRINKEGLKDIQVRQEGSRQFAIYMAGFTPEQAEVIRRKMTQVGQLEFPIVCTQANDAQTYAPYAFNKEQFDQQYFDSLKANKEDRTRPIWKAPDPFRWAPRRPQRLKGQTVEDYKTTIEDYERKLNETPWELKDQGEWLFYDPVYWNGPNARGFTGRDIESPARTVDEHGGLAVSFQVREASQNFLAAYSEHFKQKVMALVLNGEIWNTATIREQLSDNVQISGGQLGFSETEQSWLINCLQSGSLKLKPKLLSTEQLGATLGARSIQRGTMAFIIGTLLVVGFMLVYYRVAGFLAIISQIANFLLIFAAMIILDASLTLPGIAGLVLTIGMAVDANILVFERIREELAKGKTLAHGCENGFARAFITIFDSNLTTFVPAAFLVAYGQGPIKGFGYTLMVGIVCTVFSTTFFTRTLLGIALKKGWVTDLKFMQILEKTNIPFLSKARKAITISAVVILIGLGFIFVTPDRKMYSLDFNGGTAVRVNLAEPMTRSEVLDLVGNIKTENGKEKYEGRDAVVIDPEGARSRIVDLRLDYVVPTAKASTSQNEEGEDEFREIQDELKAVFGTRLVPRAFTDVAYDGTTNTWSGKLNFANDVPDVAKLKDLISETGAMTSVQVTPVGGNRVFTVVGQVMPASKDNVEGVVNRRLAAVTGFEVSNPFPKVRFLGKTVVADLTQSAWIATVMSLAFILLYMWFRFKDLEYGVAATVALVHDVLIALGFTVAFNFLNIVEAPISLDVIAAFLTIIGYSLNDTIVIFDRIRENLGSIRGTFEEIIERSINQTLSRTILTSLTVFLTVLAVFVTNYGIESPLEGFSFTMLIGTLAGTYSTIYIAAPVIIWFRNRSQKKSAPTGSAKPATA